MPDLSRNLSGNRRPHPSAWIPQASTAAILFLLAIAVIVFVKTLVGLRARLGLEDPKIVTGLAVAFILMELYLWKRAWRHVHASRDLFRRARENGST